MAFEFRFALVGKKLMQSVADRVQIEHQQGILLFSACFEVHVNLVFGQAACHELSIGRNDVAPVRDEGYFFLHKAVGHVVPILSFGKHDDTCLEDNGDTHQHHH